MTLLAVKPRVSRDRIGRIAVCWETQESFPSYRSAADWAGVNPRSISLAARTGCVAGGFHFISPDGHPKLRESKSRWVRCLETGDVFISMESASVWLRVHHGVRWSRRHIMLRVMESYQFGDAVMGRFHFEYVPVKHRREAVKDLYGRMA